jgi:adenylate kinase family enzyme
MLASEYPLKHISVGDLLRDIKAENTHPHASAVASALETQDLVDSKILMSILKEELNKSYLQAGVEAIILDGFPRNKAQIADFETEVINPLLLSSYSFVCWRCILTFM